MWMPVSHTSFVLSHLLYSSEINGVLYGTMICHTLVRTGGGRCDGRAMDPTTGTYITSIVHGVPLLLSEKKVKEKLFMFHVKNYNTNKMEKGSVFSHLNHLDLKIDEAENAFALCNFECSLSLANEILNDRHSSVERSHDEINITEHSPAIIKLRVPRVVLLGKKKEEEERSKAQDDSASFFVVNVILNLQQQSPSSSTSSSCIRERACAILIQSAYELWKRRNGYKVDEKLCLDVSLFEKSCSASRNFGEEYSVCDSLGLVLEHPVLLTLELVLLYIQFCHTIGLYKSSLDTSLRILVTLIRLESDGFPTDIIHGDGDDERNCLLDSCYNYSYEFLSIILVRTIPYIKQVRLVESIVDVIFSLIIKKRFGEQGKDCFDIDADEIIPMWDNLFLSPKVYPSSIHVMCRNVEAILISGEESLPIYFWEALRDSLLDAKELIIPPKSVDDTSLGMDHKQRATETTNNESSTRFTDFEMEPLGQGNEQNGTVDLLHKMTEPLWESENRWINRGKIALACLFSYTVWRERRRVWTGTKLIGKRISSPVHDIVRAVVMPNKK